MPDPLHEQVVKMRSLAQTFREQAAETADLRYRRKFEAAAIELETTAERMDRTARFRARYRIAS